MSCTLYYRPVSKKTFSIGEYQLRDILERKFGYPSIISYQNIAYLQALDDAGIEGARDLIEP